MWGPGLSKSNGEEEGRVAGGVDACVAGDDRRDCSE